MISGVKISELIDLTSLADCHKSAFPKSLASALGTSFIQKVLSWYLSTDKAFLFHIKDESGNCAGYCGGMISDGSLDTGSASGMAQHTFWSAIRAFITHPWVFFHPEFLAKWPVIRNNILIRLGLRSKNHFTPEQQKSMSKEPKASLVVIGVDPRHQGKGYGSILLQEFGRRAVQVYGIHKLQLTVRADNAQAIRVYQKNGWQRGEEKVGSLSMWKDI